MRRPAAISPAAISPAAIAIALLLMPRLLLAAPADCSLSSDPTACRLDQFLNWLHFAAVVLGLLLVVVIVIAVRIVQRNRQSSDSLSRKNLSRQKKDPRR